MLTQLLDSIKDSYDDLFINQRDPRVDGWLLMGSPWPTFFICVSYVLIVKVLGPMYMKTRPPFNFRKLLIAYNAFQVVFSAWIFYELGMSGWFGKYSFQCQPVDYSNDPLAIRMTHASWWYYFSKFSEFIDTLFFVARKKFEHVSTLHVIHHGCMPMSVWFGVKFTPGGHSTFFGLLNSFVHIVMYFYYMLAALGPQYSKYTWWKKHLTTLQMVQFIMIFTHAFQLCFTECEYPRAFMWWIGGHAVMFFFLFSDFYKKAYLHRKAGGVKPVLASFMPCWIMPNSDNNNKVKSNGHSNGHANGHLSNGNGVLSNGSANGHTSHMNGGSHTLTSNGKISNEESNGFIPKAPDSPALRTRARLASKSRD